MPEEELALTMELIKENGLDTFTCEVDGKAYNILAMDYNDFVEICKNETIEDFIRRVQPADDNELSYLIGQYLSQKLKKY